MSTSDERMDYQPHAGQVEDVPFGTNLKPEFNPHYQEEIDLDDDVSNTNH